MESEDRGKAGQAVPTEARDASASPQPMHDSVAQETGPKRWFQSLKKVISGLAAAGLIAFAAERAWDYYYTNEAKLNIRAGYFLTDMNGNRVYVVAVNNIGKKSMHDLKLQVHLQNFEDVDGMRAISTFPNGVNMILDESDVSVSWLYENAFAISIKELRPGTGYDFGVTSKTKLEYVVVEAIAPDFSFKETF